MSSTGSHTRSQHELRGWKFVRILTVLGLLMTTLVQTGFGSDAPVVQAADGPFTIDGALIPDVGAFEFLDPSGSVKELGPINGSDTKLSPISSALPPMLGFTDVPGKSDLKTIWLDVEKDASDDQWLYFAWERESTSGSTVLAYEFQQEPAPIECDFTGISQEEPPSGTPDPAQQDLIDNCNPWSNRSAGDFMIVFDFGGSSIDIATRTWDGTSWSAPTALDATVSQAALNSTSSRGEGALNLTATIFAGLTECLSIANGLPGTITGNSDSADYKDTLLADTSEIFISNCGEVRVEKITDPAGATDTFDVTIDQDDGGNVNFDSDASLSGTLAGDGGVVTFPDLLEDTDYVLEETNLPPGWLIYNIDVAGQNGDYTNGFDTFEVVSGETTVVTITNLKLVPSYTITKTVTDVGGEGAGASADEAGDVIDYEIAVTNTGNQGISNVVVTDPLLGGDLGAPASGDTDGDGVLDADESISNYDSDGDLKLDAAETWIYTASYVVTQGDLNSNGTLEPDDTLAGFIDNTASVVSAQIPTTQSASASVPVVQSPALLLDKVASPTTYDAVGNVIDYSYLVTNSGNVSLAGPVTVADDKATVTCPAVSTVGNGDGFLDPTEAITCDASYTITQADLNAGSVTNVAVASADGVDSNQDQETVTAVQNPALTLVKTASPTTYDAVGNVIDYSYLVTNSGNVSLAGPVTVADDKATVTCPAVSTVGNGDGFLDPTEAITCDASYTITQADLNAGSVTNVAVASADGVDSNQDQETVTAVQNPALTLVKTASPTTYDAVGNVIDYSYLVTNSGNVSLAGPVTVADDKATVTCPAVSTVGNGDGFLDPTEAITCDASYTITQADLNAGSVTNVAVASADGVDSNQDQETVTAVQNPALTLVKTASPTTYDAVGDFIGYSYLVTNSGNVSLAGPVTVADDKATVTCPAVSTVGNGDGFLDPTEAITCDASYTITQADLNAGSVTNVAVASADGVDSNQDQETVTAVQNPALTLVKTASPTTYDAVGDFIGYSYLVTNSGNVSLAGPVTVADDKATVTCPAVSTVGNGDGFLDPTEAITCDASYTITQADLNAGSVTNVAQASADGVDSNQDDETVTAEQNPAIEIVKSGAFNDENLDGFADAGETVTYTYVVENTGNVTLTDLVVSDDFEFIGPPDGVGSNANLGAITCAPIAQDGTLVPGGTTTCSAIYTLDQTDVDNGELMNVATATGTDPNQLPVSDDDDATVTAPQAAEIVIVKTGVFNDENADTFGDAGETVTYTYAVENTGNVTLTDLDVSDSFTLPALVGDLGPITCSPIAQGGTLAPTDTTTCTATYTLSQADVDNGQVDNLATAAGIDPDGGTVDDTDVETVVLPADAEIVIVKTGVFNDENADTFGDAGETVTYTYAVENTGNVTLTDLDVSDSFTLPALVGDLGPITCSPIAQGGTLAPTDTTTCTATYTLSQADVDNGQVDNLATAAGIDPDGGTVDDTDVETVVLPADAEIVIVKTGVFNDENADTFGDAGETVTYTYAVENTGNVTLTDLDVSDSFTLPALVGDLGPITCSPIAQGGTLAPTDTTTCTATYTLSQADVDNGQVDNLATAAGIDPDGGTVDDTDVETVVLPADAEIVIVKTGVFNDDGDGVAQVGESISYTYVVENTGNVTLTDLDVSDSFTLPALVGDLGPITCSPIAQGGTLAPTDTTTCTATYTLSQADVDNGQVDNLATAAGIDPDGGTVDDTDVETVVLPADAEIVIVKTGVFNDDGDGVAQVGESISYTYVVENTGNVTLTDLDVSDSFTLPALVGDLGPITCSPIAQGGTLAPTDTTTCTATYTLSQADVDNGQVDNLATAAGIDPDGGTVDDTDVETVVLPQDALIEIVKGGTWNDDGDGVAPATVGDGVAQAGETIAYTFDVTNTGNVTLTGVTVTDPLVGLSTIDCVPAQGSTLLPGDTMACTASYALTQGDVDAGQVDNTADVDGTDPAGANVNDDDSNTEVLPQDALIEIVKGGTWNDDGDGVAPATVGDGVAQAGETIAYTFDVTNTGNVTLTGVTVTDPLVGLSTIDCVPAQGSTLLPGDTMACTASYALTQGDVDAGQVDNTADVDGTDPAGANVNDDDSNTEVLPQDALIEIVKGGTWNDDGDGVAPATVGDGVAQAGETIAYTFDVTNTGNVTLIGVTVTDPLVGLSTIDCVPAQGSTLLPGDTMACTASYALTQGDVDAGQVDNTADVDGTDPAGANVNDDDSNTEVLPQDALIEIVKGGTWNDDGDGVAPATVGDGVAQAGETIAYTFDVTNTGNVTLTGVTVTDPLVGLSTIDCVPAQGSTLLPGDTMACTASYALTQGDVDAGQVDNTADVDGTDPAGANVNDDDSNTEVLPQDALIEIVKGGTWNDDGDGVAPATVGDGVAQAGETIAYTFDVTNTGNVTLIGVTVTDPLVGLSTIDCVPAQGSTLLPGDTMACTASYALTQGDVDAGQVDNTADVDGTDPAGANVNDDDSNTEVLPQDALIEIVKGGTWNDDGDGVAPATVGDGVAQAGETIAYTFDVTNTGNVTLTGVTVTDPLVGLSTIDCVPAQGSTLLPGDTMACTASYALTQGDVDAGQVDNTADVDGTDPAGANVNDDDSNTEVLPQDALIEIVKGGTWNDDGDGVAPATVGDGVAQAGETIAYTFDVTNTGNVTLTGVTVTDPLVGLSTIDCVPAQGSTLLPGDTMACTASYALTQGDVDAGQVDNTADVDGTDPAGANVNDDDSNTEVLPQDALIEIVKGGTWNDDGDGVAPATVGDGVAQAGETIAYTFDVTNTGNVTLTGVTVTDPLVGLSTIDCVPAQGSTLLPGDTMACTASYALTQGDVDAGQVDNTADVDGTDPAGANVNDDDSNTEVLPQDALIEIVKGGTWNDDGDGVAPATVGDGVAQAGETIAYTFDVTNTGNVTLTGVTVTDPLVGLSTIDCVPAQGSTLLPGDTMACTASYALTQGDVDAGQVDNTADVDGTDPAGANVNDDDSNTEVLPQDPSIDLVKTGLFQDEDGDGFGDVGETITYSFTVTNDGNVTLKDVTLADTVGGVTISGGPITTLDVGASDSTTFTGSYTLIQDDVDAATFTNTATATGTPPIGPDVTDPDDDTRLLPQDPSIDLVKTGLFQDEDGDGFGDVGETITYSFTVTNDGNVTLKDVTLADTVGGVTISGGPITTLDVGASDSTTFTGSYTLIQDDVDAATFTNTATATGTPPIGPNVSDPDDDVQPLAQDPSIDLVKTGLFQDEDGDGFGDVGETITYSFTVTNDGNVTLKDVTLADTVGGVTISGGPITTLDVGASDSTTFTGSYTLIQDDVDAATFTNTATATGTPPIGPNVSDPDDDVQPLAQDPSILLLKTGTLNDDDGTPGVSAGDTISYVFTVANDGNVTLTNVTLDDTIGGVTISGGPIATLAVGAVDLSTFTGTYTLTQANIDDATFTNVATATGTPPIGDPVSDDDDDTQSFVPGPSIELIKAGTLNDDDGTAGVSAGDTITYAFTVTNDGNVTLTDVTLADTIGGVTIDGGPLATLAVGSSDSTTFTGSYTLTQANVDAGTFTNVATATGTPPIGDPVSDDDDDVQVLEQTPSIELIKSGTLNDDDGTAGVSAGDTITYAFTVTNDGNVTLTDVTLVDTIGGVTIDGGPLATLAVGASDTTTFTGSYTLTQANVDAGTFTNVALATGTPPIGDPVSDDDDDVQVLEQTPSIELIKSGTLNDDDGTAGVSAGDTITYAFTVTNDGNVTLTDVTLVDTIGGVTIDGGPLATLAVGASDTTTFTGSYTLTQANVDAGTFTNVATATGTPPIGDPVTDDDNDVQELEQTPSILLDKTGTLNDDDGTPGVSEGDTISYVFTVTNDGNVTLTNVTLADTIGGVTITGAPIPTLAVDAVDNSTFAGSYAVTQADIDAGEFYNLATVTGTPIGASTASPPILRLTEATSVAAPAGSTVTAQDDDLQPLAQTPSIALIKTGTFNDETGDGFADVGETISYSFTVTNTGNVTLTDVTLADTIGGVTILGGPIATLAVGAVDGTTFTGSYTLTQADVDAGSFENVATATGTPPIGDPVSDDDNDIQELEQTPAIDLVKTGTFTDEDGDGFGDAGETITYAFTVTNTGNVTLVDVTLADTVGGVTIAGGPIATLAVGAVDGTTFTGSYTLTQTDVDAGTFANIATAAGTPPIGDPVTDDDDDVQPLAQDPSIVLVKSGTLNDDDGTAGVSAGDTISYAFTVTNTGNVTLTDVTLADTIGGVTISGGPIDALAVGAVDSTTFTGSYTLTQADVDAGSFENVAIATGTPPIGGPVSDDDDDIQELEQTPSIALIKTGTFNDETGDGFADVGETISYSFTVTNTGNVTLTGVTLADTVGGVTISGGPIASLAVGAVDRTTFTGSYTLTQADVDAGTFENLATVTGTPPTGDPVVDDDDDIRTLSIDADLAIVKTASVARVGAGNDFDWILDVTNHGPATATSVVVGDLVPSPFIVTGVSSSDFDCTRSGNSVSCTTDSMVVDATGRVTIAVSVPLTADGGTFVNVGTVESETPDSDLTNNSDEESVIVVAQAAPTTTLPPVTLPKTGSDATGDIALGALFLVLIGAGALVVTRRRREESTTAI